MTEIPIPPAPTVPRKSPLDGKPLDYESAQPYLLNLYRRRSTLLSVLPLDVIKMIGKYLVPQTTKDKRFALSVIPTCRISRFSYINGVKNGSYISILGSVIETGTYKNDRLEFSNVISVHMNEITIVYHKYPRYQKITYSNKRLIIRIDSYKQSSETNEVSGDMNGLKHGIYISWMHGKICLWERYVNGKRVYLSSPRRRCCLDREESYEGFSLSKLFLE